MIVDCQGSSWRNQVLNSCMSERAMFINLFSRQRIVVHIERGPLESCSPCTRSPSNSTWHSPGCTRRATTLPWWGFSAVLRKAPKTSSFRRNTCTVTSVTPSGIHRRLTAGLRNRRSSISGTKASIGWTRRTSPSNTHRHRSQGWARRHQGMAELLSIASPFIVHYINFELANMILK